MKRKIGVERNSLKKSMKRKRIIKEEGEWNERKQERKKGM